MMMMNEYLEEIKEFIEEEKDSLFETRKMTKAGILADRDCMHRLWAAYQKAVETYRLEPRTAYQLALEDVLCIHSETSEIPESGESAERGLESQVILVEVIERCIEPPMFFDTWEAARQEMIARFKDVLGLTDDDLDEAREDAEDDDYGEGVVCNVVEFDEDTGFSDEAAWCEVLGQNYDWKIFEARA